jgi:TP901 family phage tail tape measure protein
MAAAAGIAFGSFEKSMNRVKALTGETGLAFNMMEKQAKQLGKTTQFSAGEAADAMGFLAMAGFKSQEIIAAMPGVLELAASATLDLASAADITSNILTGYGRTVDQVNETNDILVKAFTSANTDLVQLGQAFKFVGPVAKSAGVSFEEATATLALMGNAGIQASMAGTALRGAITKLLTPTNKASKAMARIGINALAAQGNILPMADIVQQLGDKSVNTADMMTIFGLRAGPAMAGLVSQGADALRELTGELEESGGTASRVAATQMEGLSGAFIRLKSAAEGAFIDMGEQLAPALTLIIDKFIVLSNWISDVAVPAFTSLSPTMQIVIGAIVGIAAAIGPVLSIMGMMVSSIGGLLTALGGGVGLIGILAKVVAFMTGPVGIAIAIGVLLMSFKPTRDIILSVAAILKNVFVAGMRIAVRFIKDCVTWVKEWLLEFEAIQGVISFVGKAIDVIKGGVSKFTEGVKDAAVKTSRWGETLEEAAIRKAKEAEEHVERLTGALEDLIIKTTTGGGTLQEMSEMLRLLKIGGADTQENMEGLAFAVQGLAVEGEDLSADLQGLVNEFGVFDEEVSNTAGTVNEELTPAMTATAEEAKRVGQEAQNLADELSGKGLARDVKVLTQAWEKLEPEARANKEIMLEVGQQALTLSEEGGVLSDTFIELAESAKQAASDIKKADEEAKQAKAIQDIIDRATRADIPGAVAKLQASWERLTEAQRTNTGVLRFYRDAIEQATAAGGVFEGSLGDLDFATLDLTESQEELIAAAEALAKRFSKSELQGKVTVLELAIKNLKEENNFTAQSMLALAKQALALRDAGAELSDEMNVLADSVEGVNGALEDSSSTWGKIKGLAKKHIGGLNDIFKAAFEGGGGVKGAIESFATGVLEDLLVMIPVVGELLSQFAGTFVAAGKKIWGALKGLFGGPSEAEKAGRALVKTFEDVVIASLSQVQQAESGGERWKQVVIGVRDAYLKAGRSASEAHAIVERLWEASKKGPEAVQAVIDSIQTVLDVADAIDKLTEDTIQGLVDLAAEGARTGSLLPEQLQPFLDKLVELGELTTEDMLLLMAMAEQAQYDWKEVQAAAERYGIEVDHLGKRFQAAKWGEKAAQVAADWELMNVQGAKANKIARRMSKTVQALIDDYVTAGIAIPAALKPVIEKQVEMGLLTDENGVKITDVSQLDFAAPIVSEFDKLITAIERLIDKLVGDGGVTDSIAAVNATPIADRVVHVDVQYDDQGYAPHYDDQGMGGGGYSHGTGGRYVDFGAGTPTVLHGKERVMTESEGKRDAAGVGALENRLASIERLLQDQPRAFGVAVSDSLTLIN